MPKVHDSWYSGALSAAGSEDDGFVSSKNRTRQVTDRLLIVLFALTLNTEVTPVKPKDVSTCSVVLDIVQVMFGRHPPPNPR